MHTLEILTLALVLITGWYVLLTYKILKANNRLEAYDRRLKVYDAIKKFIAEVQKYGTTDNEKLIEMLRETRHAKFLFAEDDDMEKYTTSLYLKGLDLEYKEKAISGKFGKNTEHHQNKLVKDAQEILDWFSAQFSIVDDKFKKYLQL
jgi:hypothetical protein